jgi:hypothetical protein
VDLARGNEGRAESLGLQLAEGGQRRQLPTRPLIDLPETALAGSPKYGTASTSAATSQG